MYNRREIERDHAYHAAMKHLCELSEHFERVKAGLDPASPSAASHGNQVCEMDAILAAVHFDGFRPANQFRSAEDLPDHIYYAAKKAWADYNEEM